MTSSHRSLRLSSLSEKSACCVYFVHFGRTIIALQARIERQIGPLLEVMITNVQAGSYNCRMVSGVFFEGGWGWGGAVSPLYKKTVSNIMYIVCIRCFSSKGCYHLWYYNFGGGGS